MVTQATDPNAGLGIGVIQPQSGLDFPFVAPGLGTNSLALADVEELFADFYLSYDDPGYYRDRPLHVNPLRLYWLYGFGAAPAFSSGAPPIPGIPKPTPPHAQDLLVLDASNRVVFDSTAADVFSATPWGEHYTIYEWVKTTKPNEAVCRAVVYNNLHSNTQPPARPSEFYPRNAVLDERTIEKIPKRVLALRVQNGTCVTPWFKNKVTLVNGFNTELAINAENTFNLNLEAEVFNLANTAIRTTTDITLSADAGTGAGQFGLCSIAGGLNCDETRPTNVCPIGEDTVITICNEATGEEIKTINGVQPDANGNIQLNAADCIYSRAIATYTETYEPGTTRPQRASSSWSIGADCQPCCDCEDYTNVAKYLNTVGERYSAVGTRVSAVKTVHEQNISRWNAQRECRYAKPLRLFLIQQPCPCIDVVIMYCNHCADCADNVTLTLQLSSDPAGASGRIFQDYNQVVSGNESTSTIINGGWPIFSVSFPRVNAGQLVYAQTRICFCPAYPYIIHGTLSGVKTGGPILAGCEPDALIASDTASVTLDCRE